MKRYVLLAVVWTTVAVLVATIVWRAGQHTTRPMPARLAPAAVRGLPVLWLGDVYDSKDSGTPDMPLRSATMNNNPVTRDPIDGTPERPMTYWYSLGYGDCRQPTPWPGHDSSGCPMPLSIDFYDVCGTPPLDTTGMPHVLVRGVDAVEYMPGGLWIRTADVTIKVDAWGKTLDEQIANARQVAEDLVGANPEAAAFGKGVAFRARDEAAVRERCGLPSTPAP